MPKPIGPTFGDEIRAAGLAGLPFAWGDDGTFTFSPAMTAEQIAAVEAVYEAHDPTKSTPAATKDAKIAAGCQIVFSSNANLSATYGIGTTDRTNIFSIASAVAAGLGFPEGAATFDYPDFDGTQRTFTEAEFVALYKAVRDYVFNLEKTAAMLAAGAPAEWPAQPITVA